MSGFEQGGRGVDALLGGLEIVGKIETERKAESDVSLGDEATILCLLGGLQGFARKFASELRRRDAAGFFLNLAFKHCALHRGLQHARASFEDAVFFFCTETEGSGTLGGGTLQFAGA